MILVKQGIFSNAGIRRPVERRARGRAEREIIRGVRIGGLQVQSTPVGAHAMSGSEANSAVGFHAGVADAESEFEMHIRVDFGLARTFHRGFANAQLLTTPDRDR